MVGVSRCLLGDAVRYDGRSKANSIVLDKLGKLFELVAVCPEVEAGLGVPRPPVALSGNIEEPKLTGRDDPSIDITDLMQHYCQSKVEELSQLSGFICKSRSPSCGLNSTPVFIDDACVTETSRGIFTRALCLRYPELPVIEDSDFSEKSISSFLQQVQAYHRLRK
jgi:uncharacterized protein YbbK (DUF523 family)